MGGSSPKPQDGELKGNKEALSKRREQIAQDLQGDLFQLRINLENIFRNPTYYKKAAFEWLAKARKKTELLKKLKC